MASHTRDTGAPSDAGIASDTTQGISATPANLSSKPLERTGGPTAGMDNNVDYSAEGEGKKKEGFMDKVKDKLTPGIKGPDTSADHSVKHAAAFEQDQLKGRHGQANADLNRQ